MGLSKRKKPREKEGLAAEFSRGSSVHSAVCVVSDNEQHRDRITRLSALKQRAKIQENELFNTSILAGGVHDPLGLLLWDTAFKLQSCCHYLLFRHYYDVDKYKLINASCCKVHLLCPVCAHNRAGKQVKAYSEKFELLRQKYPKLKPVMITLTVKNGDDLVERYEHLKKSFEKYQLRRRQKSFSKLGNCELSKAQGAVFSYEFTKSDKGWHPHIHMVALLDDWIDQGQMSQEWHDITVDSFIVDVRRIQKTNTPVGTSPYSKAFCEVFKYALKFSDLSPSDTTTAWVSLSNKRLQGSFGIFRGVKFNDNITENILKDEPYLELLYKYSSTSYSLRAITRSEDRISYYV